LFFKAITKNGISRQDTDFFRINDRELLTKIQQKYFGENADTSSQAYKNLKMAGIDTLEDNTIYLLHSADEFHPEAKVYKMNEALVPDYTKFYLYNSTYEVEKISFLNIEYFNAGEKLLLFAFLDKKQVQANHELIRELKTLANSVINLQVLWGYFSELKFIAQKAGLAYCVAPCIVAWNPMAQRTNSEENSKIETYRHIWVMENSAVKDYETIGGFLTELNTYKTLPGISDETRQYFANNVKYYEKLRPDEMDFDYLKNVALKNEKDYIIICVRSYQELDYKQIHDNLKVLRSFFRKVHNMDFVALVFNLDIQEDIMGGTLDNFDTILITSELKKTRKPHRVIKGESSMVKLAFELLSLKKMRLDKEISISKEERDAGFTFDALFEGRFS